MSCLQHKGRNHTCSSGFDPASGAHTPLLTGFQPREIIFGPRGGKIVPDTLGEFEKFGSELHAGCVFACVFAIRLTATVSEKSGQGIPRAGTQNATKNIFLKRHGFKPPVAHFRAIAANWQVHTGFIFGAMRVNSLK